MCNNLKQLITIFCYFIDLVLSTLNIFLKFRKNWQYVVSPKKVLHIQFWLEKKKPGICQPIQLFTCCSDLFLDLWRGGNVESHTWQRLLRLSTSGRCHKFLGWNVRNMDKVVSIISQLKSQNNFAFWMNISRSESFVGFPSGNKIHNG